MKYQESTPSSSSGVASYQSLSSPSSSSSTVGVDRESLGIKLYLLTAPMEEKDRGDTDYTERLRESLSDKGVTVDYITGASQINTGSLYDAQKMYNEREGNEQIYKVPTSAYRIGAIKNIVNYLQNQTQSSSSSSKQSILHLQLRAPETGCMIHPEDIMTLKSGVNHFFITCHEWYHRSLKIKT